MKNLDKCCVDGCRKPVKVAKHQLCNAHYMRYLKFGDVGVSKVQKRKFIPAYIPKITLNE